MSDDDPTAMAAPMTWHVDERLEAIEKHLELLGIDDGAVETFVECWNAADEPEKERLHALGDTRLIDEIRNQVGHRDVFIPEGEIDLPADGTLSPEITGDGTGEALPPVPEEDTEALDVVEGSVKSVLKWVGRDPERARRALMAEMLMQDPRQSLLVPLQKLADF